MKLLQSHDLQSHDLLAIPLHRQAEQQPLLAAMPWWDSQAPAREEPKPVLS